MGSKLRLVPLSPTPPKLCARLRNERADVRAMQYASAEADRMRPRLNRGEEGIGEGPAEARLEQHGAAKGGEAGVR